MTDNNSIFWVLLIVCFYMHILDDFVLQKPCLCDLKQRSWWLKQIGHPDFERSQYAQDYIAALLIHSAQWSIGVLLPLILYTLYKGIVIDARFFLFAAGINTAIHAYVDNLKANELQINLIEDQLAHVVQIVVTVALFTLRNCI